MSLYSTKYIREVDIVKLLMFNIRSNLCEACVANREWPLDTRLLGQMNRREMSEYEKTKQERNKKT